MSTSGGPKRAAPLRRSRPVTGHQDVTADQLVDAYMLDIPASWLEMERQLEGLNIRTVPDAGRPDLADALGDSDVTILVAHHVQDDQMASIGIELVDGVLAVSDIPGMSPTSASAIVDLLGVCRSVSLIPLLKARCGSARVVARETRDEPINRMDMIPKVLRTWRRSGDDYAEVIFRLHMAFLDKPD
jgi:hypothetical protein